jgi:hypothetical protein
MAPSCRLRRLTPIGAHGARPRGEGPVNRQVLPSPPKARPVRVACRPPARASGRWRCVGAAMGVRERSQGGAAWAQPCVPLAVALGRAPAPNGCGLHAAPLQTTGRAAALHSDKGGRAQAPHGSAACGLVRVAAPCPSLWVLGTLEGPGWRGRPRRAEPQPAGRAKAQRPAPRAARPWPKQRPEGVRPSVRPSVDRKRGGPGSEELPRQRQGRARALRRAALATGGAR